MIKNVLNAFISITTQIFSFFANYDFEFRMSFDLVQLKENTIRKSIQRFKDKKIVFIMKKIWKFVKTHMKKNQLSQTKHVDKHKTFASNYQVKD
jgi:hypothetical protein